MARVSVSIDLRISHTSSENGGNEKKFKDEVKVKQKLGDRLAI